MLHFCRLNRERGWKGTNKNAWVKRMLYTSSISSDWLKKRMVCRPSFAKSDLPPRHIPSIFTFGIIPDFTTISVVQAFRIIKSLRVRVFGYYLHFIPEIFCFLVRNDDDLCRLRRGVRRPAEEKAGTRWPFFFRGLSFGLPCAPQRNVNIFSGTP